MDAFAVLAATWPPAEAMRLGPWTLRRGAGGGSRVSAATLEGEDGAIEAAAAAMLAWGQAPLFMIRDGEAALDARLAAMGYARRDPTLILAAPSDALAAPEDGGTTVRCTAPVARMEEIWEAGGIGPGRRAVMARVAGPRVWLLGRQGDRPAACAFVAVHGGTAMLHALEVVPEARRQGMGSRLTRAAARWAAARGGAVLALAVTEANAAARALYGGLGMRQVARYHYRVAPDAPPVPLPMRNR